MKYFLSILMIFILFYSVVWAKGKRFKTKAKNAPNYKIKIFRKGKVYRTDKKLPDKINFKKRVQKEKKIFRKFKKRFDKYKQIYVDKGVIIMPGFNFLFPPFNIKYTEKGDIKINNFIYNPRKIYRTPSQEKAHKVGKLIERIKEKYFNLVLKGHKEKAFQLCLEEVKSYCKKYKFKIIDVRNNCLTFKLLDFPYYEPVVECLTTFTLKTHKMTKKIENKCIKLYIDNYDKYGSEKTFEKIINLLEEHPFIKEYEFYPETGKYSIIFTFSENKCYSQICSPLDYKIPENLEIPIFTSLLKPKKIKRYFYKIAVLNNIKKIEQGLKKDKIVFLKGKCKYEYGNVHDFAYSYDKKYLNKGMYLYEELENLYKKGIIAEEQYKKSIKTIKTFGANQW